MSVQTPHPHASSDLQPHQWDNTEGRGIDKLTWMDFMEKTNTSALTHNTDTNNLESVYYCGNRAKNTDLTCPPIPWGNLENFVGASSSWIISLTSNKCRSNRICFFTPQDARQNRLWAHAPNPPILRWRRQEYQQYQGTYLSARKFFPLLLA